MKKRSLTNTYLSTLCLEMHMLLDAGMTIHHGAQVMLDDEPDRDAKEVLQALQRGLDAGQPLSGALRDSQYFPDYMVSMVEIGERTGRLTDTLYALSQHYERQERLKTAVRSATLYPAILLGMMVVVVMILIVQVLPIFNDVFGRMGAQMSPLAETLMNFGAWFRGASVVIAAVAFGIFFLLFLAWAIPAVRNGLAKWFRNKWGARGIFGRIHAFQFVSSLSLGMSSGLMTEDAVRLAASLNKDSQALQAKYDKCLEMVNAGESLADALKASKLLSARDGRLLSLGDQSGKADSTMVEIARRSDTSVQDEIARVVGRIEPTLVITTSVIIGIILLSVMLPLIGIMTSLG
ncbi:MAG: type II secretion system F family protein [Defluviitaleaceae bacterium]|nr:type II secretion system F family protein [Defluviitaleaceae bacterium]